MGNLYTFIMHYCGGKYIMQVRGENERHALNEWIKRLKYEKIEKTGPEFVSYMEKLIDDEIPVKILETNNVWGIYVLPLNRGCDVDIIMTAEGENETNGEPIIIN